MKFKNNLEKTKVKLFFVHYPQKFMSRIFHKESFFCLLILFLVLQYLSKKNSLRNHFIKTMTMNRTMQSSSHIFHIHLTWRKKFHFSHEKGNSEKQFSCLFPFQFCFYNLNFFLFFCCSFLCLSILRMCQKLKYSAEK